MKFIDQESIDGMTSLTQKSVNILIFSTDIHGIGG